MRAVNKRSTGKNAQKKRKFDWRTPLMLLVFFPAGITRMWRSGCRWPKAVKYAVSGFYMAAALTAATAMVLSNQPAKGGVELCGAENAVEIYGPELPEGFVAGYTKTTGNSGVMSEVVEEDNTTYVYAAEDAKCYHTWKCKFAYASSKRITPYEAYYLGYKPCGLCHPPVYDPVTGKSS